MHKPDATVDSPVVARVVHRSVIVDELGTMPVVKLMFNIDPQGCRVG